MITPSQIEKQLISLKDPEYCLFMQKLIPDCDNILGVRMPKLRKLVNQIPLADWQSYLCCSPKFLEEALLQAIIIGKNTEKYPDFELIKQFIPNIINWAICDTFCASLKFIHAHRPATLNFIKSYINSDNEFENRFANVILLNYFIKEEYLEFIFHTLDDFKNPHYYAQMAAAWLLAECFACFPEKTYQYLQTSKLDSKTFNKAVQKIIESLKTPKNIHSKLKKLKR